MRYLPNFSWFIAFVNSKAVTPKYVSRARLDANGFGACTKARAAGCDPRKRSIGFGDGTSGPLAAIGGLNLNYVGYVIVGLFVVTWLVALAIWRYAHIEQKWAARLSQSPDPD